MVIFCIYEVYAFLEMYDALFLPHAVVSRIFCWRILVYNISRLVQDFDSKTIVENHYFHRSFPSQIAKNRHFFELGKNPYIFQKQLLESSIFCALEKRALRRW